MNRQFILLIIFAISVYFNESCEILLYENNNLTNYYKRYDETCNDKPIYKMIGDSYFIYKSKYNYWCESYLRNHAIKCNLPCIDTRILLINDTFFNSTSEMLNSTVIEKYDVFERIWKNNTNSFITCADHENMTINDDLIRAKEQQLVKGFKMSKILISKFQNHKRIISTGSMGDRKEQIQQFIEKKHQKPSLAVVSSVSQANNSSSTTTSKSIGAQMLDKVRKNSKDGVCPLIEYRMSDDIRVKLKQSLPIYYGVNCRGFPVYKSSSNIYLYRNIFGDWCHEKLNQFLPEVRCLQRCTQKRILPTGISSPIYAKSVEIYQQFSTIINPASQRYSCAAHFNCSVNECLNGGVCSNGTYFSDNNCICKPQFSGLRCDNVIDACYSNPCLNNGTCSAKPYDDVKCHCATGYYGKNCESSNPCLKIRSNPCLNGGTCNIHKSYPAVYFCECPEVYGGKNCEIEINNLVSSIQLTNNSTLTSTTKFNNTTSLT